MDFKIIFFFISFWICSLTQDYEEIYFGENQNTDKNGTLNFPYDNLNYAFELISHNSQTNIIFYMMKKMVPYYLDAMLIFNAKNLIIR